MEMMALALYAPDKGYYSGRPRRIGRQGDFYTAVSVGPLYGKLIAEQAARIWASGGRPTPFVLAEQAAHDGQLMADMLTEITARHPEMAAALEVILIEPQQDYEQAQEHRLRQVWSGGLRWIRGLAELEAAAGLLVCNELLDALAVHRVVKKDGQWREQGVALAADGRTLVWEDRELQDTDLLKEVEVLPPDLPDGYQTEIQVAVREWVTELGRSGFNGSVWIADYGLDADDYWSPERPEGTLRRYYKHRMDDRVLEDLGQADLTCHVNFTRVQEVASAAGFRVVDDADQGRFLTRLASPWLSGLEGKPFDADTQSLLRQFQSLTHPGIMGRSFRVLLLERGL
jgi:SAM-dependent MidA family methyltransferase